MVNGVAFQGTRQTDLVTQGALSFARLPWANFRGPFGAKTWHGQETGRNGGFIPSRSASFLRV